MSKRCNWEDSKEKHKKIKKKKLLRSSDENTYKCQSYFFESSIVNNINHNAIKSYLDHILHKNGKTS